MANLSTLLGGTIQKVEKFTSSGTWTRPAGVDAVHVLIVGGGGGSAQQSQDSAVYKTGGNGGSGICIVTWYE